ncbi:MAG: hypothetical protein H6718_09160 [Polyangiaceae bacterium]|nr:hypothetical protein [Myxococcales bacterium]MCB9585555.1 hypothetical protein [Polyangiaceae bacterium]MCB9606429.1 hypothetical protein [Polyangiaceae bacterium]
MRQIVFENSLVTIEEDPLTQIVWVRRSPERTEVSELFATYTQSMTQLTETHREWSLILDMRNAPGNNSDAFESSTNELRTKLRSIFPRVVVLVATTVGELQVKRMARESGLETLVTHSEDQAVRWCRQ